MKHLVERSARVLARSVLASMALAVGGLLLMPPGCGSPRREEPLVGQVNLTDPQTLRGRQVFMTHCYQCHPGGSAGLGPAINDKPLPGWLIKTQVRKGLGAMPGFSEQHISDAQADDLVVYLKALRDLE